MFVSAIAPMTGYYDYSEVARSVLIAIAASYAALDLTGRVAAASGRVRLAWFSGGAIAMGIGIWAMHFKGMLAFHLPVSVEYHWPTVLAAFSVAILASAVALYVTSRQKMSRADALTGSIVMGAGIGGLHYIGMAAMRMPAITTYSPLLVICSLLLAVLFSLIALLMAFDLREETRWTVPRKVGSAIVMGLAVSAMHYTGMAAASFIPASPPDLSHAVSISVVGNNAIAIVSLIVIVAAMVTSSVDRRASVEYERLNQELERRVLERTSQLITVNEELAETEERFRKLVEALPDALYVHSENKIVFVNPFGMRLLGAHQPEQLVGKSIFEIVHSDYREVIRQRIQHCYQTGTASSPMECALVARDGSFVEVESAGIPTTWKGSPAVEVVARDIRERKRAEEQLRQAQTRTESVLDSMADTHILLDRGWHYLYVNRAAVFAMARPREQILGHTLWELYPDIIGTELERQYRRAMEKRIPVVFDFHYPTTNTWWENRFYPASQGLSVFATDITERKQAEEALRTSEREQHKIAEQLEIERARLIEAQAVAKVGSWETELPSLNITWSEQTHRIFETDPSYFHPTRPGFVKLVHPEDRAKVDAAFQASLEKDAPSTVEYRTVMADGRVKVLEERWKVFHDGQGRPARLIGTCQDITERKKAEQTALRLAAIVESSDDAIISKDLNGVITSWNAGAQHIFGYTAAEAVGQSITLIIPPELEDEEVNILRQLRAGTHIQHYETIRLTKHGTRVNVSLTISPIKDSQGKVVGASKIARDTTERKVAEEDLRRSEAEAKARAEELTVIFDAVPGMALIARDSSARTITGSRAAYELLRLPYGANISKSAPEGERPSSFRIISDGQELPTSELPLQKAAATGKEVRDSEYSLLFDDGTSRDMFGNAAPLLDHKGNVRGAIGVFVDITERKRAEASLRLFRMLLDQSNDAIEVVDPETLRFIDVNERTCTDLGYSREELLSMGVHDISPNAESLNLRVSDELRNSGSAVFESLHRRKDGSTFPVEVSVKQVYVDRIYRVSVVRDITERKRAEMELRRSEENYRNFVAQSSEGIFRQDLDAPIPVDLPEDELVHRILHDSYLAECNDAIAKMYGLSSQQEFVGKRLTDTLDPNDPHNVELTREYIRSGFRVLERESHEVDMQGNPKIFVNSMIGIVENGMLIRTWGIQRDVTERVRSEKARKRAERALQESQAALARVARIATMGELTASIAHEINQPLAAVAANASASLHWLAVHPPNLAEARQAMSNAMDEANRASGVIDRLRTLLKKVPPQLGPVNVNEVIRDVLALAHRELLTGGVTTRTELTPDLPTVLGDRVQLQQVLLNLIVNAIDAMSNVNGRRKSLLIKSARDAEGVLIEVQDSGKGLDPEEAPRIFDAFFTTKPEGIGMGLSISRSIVEAHGGHLQAVPGPSHGAIFQFILPKAS